MSLYTSLTELETRLNNLERSFLQAQKNQVPITAKTDSTANGLVQADTNIEQNTVDIEKNTADIDYIAMMTEVDIPVDDADASFTEIDEDEPLSPTDEEGDASLDAAAD